MGIAAPSAIHEGEISDAPADRHPRVTRSRESSLTLSPQVDFPYVDTDSPLRRVFYLDLRMPRKPKVTVVAERTEICRECRAIHCSRTEGMRCRRYPPVFVYDPSTGVSAAEWPEVNPDDWCVEFKPKLTS